MITKNPETKVYSLIDLLKEYIIVPVKYIPSDNNKDSKYEHKIQTNKEYMIIAYILDKGTLSLNYKGQELDKNPEIQIRKYEIDKLKEDKDDLEERIFSKSKNASEKESKQMGQWLYNLNKNIDILESYIKIFQNDNEKDYHKLP